MSVALITGANGFVGRHLRTTLEGEGWSVVGLGRRPAMDPSEAYRQVDLSSDADLAVVLEAVRPDVVFHLAASGPAIADVAAVVRDSALATLHLAEAIRRSGRPVRLILAGSSAQYGALPRDANPVTEGSPCRPVTAYGYGKLAAEATALGLAADGRLDVVAARAFNNVGPQQPPTTVAGAFAERIGAILAGRAERMTVGDLEVVRDFTDVRDAARGYLALAERGAAGRVYNLCTGRPSTVGDVLDGLLAAAGLDRAVVDVTPREAPAIPYQVGSPERARHEVAWTAGTPLARSMADLVASLHTG